ncbi:MBL fold metallo-hydrolase [Tropicimonas sp. IMCC34011]|uniref:MBL fold metallo-hydrolase n=1 Tax=Tropicimonas sp. IMCC34011 TaxID=2248759 RepID=UPI000E2599BC|nr:MBL fold metallo-hydrolase [Tropicimonas sp. IMCC34011]
MRPLLVLSLSLSLSLAALPAAAQDRRPSHCIALVQDAPDVEIIQANWTEPVPDEMVRITYIDHSMFYLQTPGGLDVVTDYNGYIGAPEAVPDVATMNHAHSSHWTASPDPRIPHVLTGWGDAAGPADHHLDLGEMLVRNVTTDIRSGYTGIEKDGNSIFVFEVNGLCIGHLGHLHHEPSPETYAAIGRLDVLMAPVDGGLTVPLPVMKEIVSRLRSSIVLPMHWFSGASLERFLSDMQGDFAIDVRQGSEIEVSLRTLPSRPTIVVLRPARLQSGGGAQ